MGRKLGNTRPMGISLGLEPPMWRGSMSGIPVRRALQTLFAVVLAFAIQGGGLPDVAPAPGTQASSCCPCDVPPVRLPDCCPPAGSAPCPRPNAPTSPGMAVVVSETVAQSQSTSSSRKEPAPWPTTMTLPVRSGRVAGALADEIQSDLSGHSGHSRQQASLGVFRI